MTRYTNPDHPDFWVPRWAAAGFASAGEWYDTGRKLLPSRMLSGRSYPWRDAGYSNNHMAWFRDGNQDYQAKYIVAGFTVHWKWRKTNYFYQGDSPFAKDLTPWREAGYGNDHMAWLRDGKPDPLTEDDPYYDYRYEWLAAGFAKYYDWMWADYTQPWHEAGYGNYHMAWLRDGKPDPLPIEHPNSWRPKWQSAGFSSLIEYVDAERPKPWYEAGYDYDHMAWLRDGKPDKKPNKD